MKDNFFDLGGDSLSLNTLVFDLIDAFEVDIPLDFVFRANDIQEIADYIKKNTDSVEEKKHEKNLMLIRKGDPGGKDIFFIHDGIGGIGAYFDIAQNLKEYNIWGIRVDNHLTVCPQNVKIEEVAASYVQQIVKESDPPYNIAGWCIGGTIAFEIVKQLEELGHKVDSLFIIDSIPPLIWEDAAEFSAQGEKRFIKENIKYADTIKDFVQEDSMLEIWEKTVENIERSPFKMEIVRSFVSIIPDDIKQYLKEYGNSETKDIFIFINRVRTFHIARALYFPEGKICSDITYLGANTNSVCVDNSIWQDYTNGKVTRIDVNGDHNTMLKHSGALKIAGIIKNEVR
jgi:pimeloyl-ACP methyl ester carboxylesterase